jgi:hypothetical protein
MVEPRPSGMVDTYPKGKAENAIPSRVWPRVGREILEVVRYNPLVYPAFASPTNVRFAGSDH